MSRIQKGMQVRLYSGNAVMTVAGTGADGIYCLWRDQDTLCRAVFPADALQELAPDDGEPLASVSGAVRMYRELLPGLERLSSTPEDGWPVEPAARHNDLA